MKAIDNEQRKMECGGVRIAMVVLFLFVLGAPMMAQMPPSASDRAGYTGLFAAARDGNVPELRSLLADGADPNARDGNGRTPLHVAAFAGRHTVMRVLVSGGADPNAFDRQRYDIVTIAAVANDVPTLEVALSLGGDPANVTSPYDGTALIAAAHLGHVDIVRTLVAAGAPLDHVNNLGWTALIEAIVLGDGGPRHAETVSVLLDAGADPDLPDSRGNTPLSLASARGYHGMADLIREARQRGGR
jgi:ankyrin repeat protein